VIRRLFRAAPALAGLALAACATLPPPSNGSMARLPGWAEEDHAAAFTLVRRACADTPPARRSHVCDEAISRGSLGEGAARAFMESRFRAEPVAETGVLTAYFAPAYEARRTPGGEFTAPVRPLPRDPDHAPDRAGIEASSTHDALAWMRPEDLFFLQIQGSGDLTFPGGAKARAVFAGSNGRPFVAIGKAMIARRQVSAAEASANGLHDWLAAHRGPEADEVMRLDPRYIFFRLTPDDGAEPRGSSGAALVPGRSLAIDPAFHPYFELIWIDAGDPGFAGARAAYRRLTVALDRGSAITGPARADLYLGRGAKAGDEASRVRHTLRLYRVIPSQ
jgi:membrane-bound lytic murein transglycosylase A